MPPAHLRGPNVRSEHRSGCTGKHGYLSEADALRVARKRGVTKRPYLCPICDHWHLTSRGLPPKQGKH